MERKSVEILAKARSILDKPENWTRHVMARNKDGVEGQFEQPSARKFCIAGAVYRATNDIGDCDTTYRAAAMSWLDTALHERSERTGFRFADVVTFNDYAFRTHKDVVELFDRALELARTS